MKHYFHYTVKTPWASMHVFIVIKSPKLYLGGSEQGVQAIWWNEEEIMNP